MSIVRNHADNVKEMATETEMMMIVRIKYLLPNVSSTGCSVDVVEII